jgi:uracil-DNA glycosylase
MTLKSTGGLRKSMATSELLEEPLTQEEREARRQALSGALSATESLVNEFEKVFKGCYSATAVVSTDYSKVAQKIIPEPEVIAPPKPRLETSLSVSTEDPRMHMSMQALISEALSCKRCDLCSTRKNVVFGEGCADRPTVMVIGEGPGEVEDNTGRPFVGPAGNYLDKWLKAIGLDRSNNVYITNLVKCRPPMNRDPRPEEKSSCLAFLKQQIDLIQPQSILCLGRPASSLMTGQMDAPIGSLRGRFFFYDGIPMMCTYHPAAVLRDLSLKRPVWEDLKKLARYLGLEGVMGAK